VTLVLASAAVCAEEGPKEGWIAVEGERIVDAGSGPPPAGATDLGDRVLAPGFIDLQCNGLGTVDFATAKRDEWQGALRTLAAHGVTACCPTFVTAPLDRYDAMLDAAEAARGNDDALGAAVLGVHLEGPFLGGAPRAHDPALVRAADLDWLRELFTRHPDLVEIVTLAPEADPDGAATRWLAARGVAVALGHTTASYAEALGAADAGATVVTHLFNGMTPWHHRDPGVAGAALADDRLTPTIIADLVHVHPAALRVTFATTTVATVSDAVGARDERDGAAWLPDGTLAGATVLLDGALANLVASGVPSPRAIESLTKVPARLLGLDDRGALRVGSVADLVALEPQTLAVERVWLRGEEVARQPK
jgi:N-acetylglucosamine-6-phosphate deacetylase